MFETAQSGLREHGSLVRAVAVGVWSVAGLVATRLSVSKRFGPRWVWVVVAMFSLGFAVETASALRYEVTAWFRSALRAVGGDEAIRQRRVLQAVALAGLCAAAVGSAVRLRRTGGLGRAARVALTGVGVGLVGLVMETISFHYLDQTPFLYRGFRAVALGATAAGAVAAWAARRPAPAP
jgi:hypothetical protein